VAEEKEVERRLTDPAVGHMVAEWRVGIARSCNRLRLRATHLGRSCIRWWPNTRWEYHLHRSYGLMW
jgi:hypothetical protein